MSLSTRGQYSPEDTEAPASRGPPSISYCEVLPQLDRHEICLGLAGLVVVRDDHDALGRSQSELGRIDRHGAGGRAAGGDRLEVTLADRARPGVELREALGLVRAAREQVEARRVV